MVHAVIYEEVAIRVEIPFQPFLDAPFVERRYLFWVRL